MQQLPTQHAGSPALSCILSTACGCLPGLQYELANAQTDLENAIEEVEALREELELANEEGEWPLLLLCWLLLPCGLLPPGCQCCV